MARSLVYQSNDIKNLLDTLINPNTESQQYRDTMYKLGVQFGKLLGDKLKGSNSISLACTVEDADFLAKGIIDELENLQKKILLTVFWNKRLKPNKENGISIAPIVKEFHEPGYLEADTLIILKSIISSSCVVRTNLNRLIEVSKPKKIYVLAPVLLKGAQERIASEFSAEVSNGFQYIYFAEDDEKTEEGIVNPGIGGDVYQRLGFEGQDSKNRFIPLIKERRVAHA